MEEQQLLSKSLNNLFYKINLSCDKLLTPEEELELMKRYKEQNDRKAYELLFISNVRLVYQCAATYVKEYQFLKMEDLFSEGCIGLQTALENFDYQMGYRFSTYAVYWIRNSIRGHNTQKKR